MLTKEGKVGALNFWFCLSAGSETGLHVSGVLKHVDAWVATPEMPM